MRQCRKSSQGAESNDKNPLDEGTKQALDRDYWRRREALGRSKGGLSTKIHMVVDRRCRPLARRVSPGQDGDSPQFIPVLECIRIARSGPGRPRRRPGTVMADKA